MLELKIAGLSDGPNAPPGWRTVPEGSLRYDYFLGDVIFRIEGADFTTTWGWVPVLDFAASVTSLLDTLRSGCQGVFEFTESEASLTFRRQEDLVEVTASYADGLAVIGYAEIRIATHSLLTSLQRSLQDRHPDLRSNPAFLRLTSLPGP